MKIIKHLLIFSPFILWPFLSSFSQEVNHWESIIVVGDEVKYIVPDSAIASSWVLPEFNDEEWNNGISGVGYGDDDDNTLIQNNSSIYSVYIRYHFTIPDASVISKLILDMDFDDGFVAYLNGSEIARQNLGSPNTPTSYDQLTETDIEARLYQGLMPSRFYLTKNFNDSLLNGENVLALEVHNWSTGSSDLSSNTFFHCGISDTASYYHVPPSWFIPPSEGSSNLPIVSIDTRGQTILNEPRIIADMGIINNGPGIQNNTTDPFNDYDGKISIEIRGASSQMFPKKSFTIETQTDTGTNNNVSLLGLPPENDWVLYAPYSDKTLIRNVISYRIYEQLGHWSPRTRYVDLYVNEIYQGIYVLIEKIKQDQYRVNIAPLTEMNTSEDEISGGYILQIDRTDNLLPLEFWTSPANPPYPGFARMTFEYYDPNYFELTEQQSDYIRNWINNLDEVMSSSNFKDKDTGYRKYIDVPSFIDYLIFHELCKDVDAYRLSAFYYKERDSKGGKLFAGPPWDYNLTYGNMDYGDDIREIYNWMYTKSISHYWWKRLMDDPWFKNKVYCRWISLTNSIISENKINNLIDSSVNILGPAIEANFEKWPVLGTYVWPNYFIGETHSEEIDFLKDWISDRIDWVDTKWANSCVETNSEIAKIDPPETLLFYPNPSHLSSITFTLPESFSGEYMIAIYNLQGAEILQLSDKLIFGNTIKLENMSFLPSGVYLVKFSGIGISPIFGKLIRE